MGKDQGKIIVGLFLTTIFSVLSQASFADMGANQQVLNKVDGKYGANLNNITGASIESNGTYANITNTQTNSVLNWNSLNTAPGQTLNYVMSAGQTALNRVVSPQLSTFAGNLTSTGGRVIISNPMGIIFENGSYTNVNALTLTTHDAQIVNGKLILETANEINTKGIIIGGIGASSKAAVMRVADDLNLVSNNIKIENADIFTGNANFVTSDGVTFVEKNMSITNANNTNGTMLKDSENNDIGSVYVKDSIIAVRDNSTGKVFIASKGDTAGVKIDKSVVDGKLALDVDKDVDISVIGNADVVESSIGGALKIETVDGTITLANSGNYPTLVDYVYTLDDYLTRKFGTPNYTNDQTRAYLTVRAKEQNPNVTTLSSSIVDYYHENADTTVCGTLKENYDVATSTTYTGNGNISVSNTTIGGKLTVDGANVNINNVTAYDYESNVVGTNGANAVISENVDKVRTIQKYSFNGEYDSSNSMTSGNFDTAETPSIAVTPILDRNDNIEIAPASSVGTSTVDGLKLTKPVVDDGGNNNLNGGADNNDNLAYNNDHDKNLYGDEVNTVFTRQFTPKGFAASDDEIKARKDRVKSSARSGDNNSIILNDRFIAE